MRGYDRMIRIKMSEDCSPKFSVFQYSCAAFCFLRGYFLLGLALGKTKQGCLKQNLHLC